MRMQMKIYIQLSGVIIIFLNQMTKVRNYTDRETKRTPTSVCNFFPREPPPPPYDEGICTIDIVLCLM